MAAIHPLVWVICGILIAVYAKFVHLKSSLVILDVFFYVGIIFSVFGLVRWLILKKKKASPRVVSTQDPHIKAHYGSQHQNKLFHQYSVKYCQHCGTRHHLNAQFCRRCGAKI